MTHGIRKGAIIVFVTSYSPTDADSVLRMPSNYVDYAPEAVCANEDITDTEFFRETYIEEFSRGYAYLPKGDDDNVNRLLQ